MRTIRCFLLFFLTCLVALPVQAQTSQAQTIRMGVLPALGTMPLRVATSDGLFKKRGLDVKLVPFNSAFERDTAMRTGNIDGYFGDLVAAVLMRKANVDVRVITVCTRSTPGQRMFGLVTSPKMKDLQPDQLKGRTVGLSTSTIIEYLLDLMEKKNIVPAGAMERVDIKKLPVRVQMLMSNKLDLALMPEPLASLGEFKGGKVLGTDEELAIPLTILLLRTDLAHNPELTGKFLAAYSEAVRRLADHPEKYRDLMVYECRIPKPLAPDFPMLHFPAPELPTPKAVQSVQTWMMEKKIIPGAYSYEQIVAEPR
ncbi:MAG: ABC transporter substrate-binding protein [Desulfovibrio sp.]|uniref:ABC transporter substrate-binding protein n=1 Tax=Desulfovibrio sp. 7SRBS1 TaxID=3378064 RepID=UPI003B3F0F19